MSPRVQTTCSSTQFVTDGWQKENHALSNDLTITFLTIYEKSTFASKLSSLWRK